MGYDWVSQDANLSVEEMDEDTVYEDLEYEIVYVQEGRLYQRCLKELMSEDFFWFSEVIPGDLLDYEWKEKDDPTKASKLYQAFWDGESYDEYILCYPDKIIKVSPNFTKELMDEDLVIIDEELGGLK